ncbi:MAG: hypothetical protein ACR2G2_09200 [Pseudonocardia sp.]
MTCTDDPSTATDDLTTQIRRALHDATQPAISRLISTRAAETGCQELSWWFVDARVGQPTRLEGMVASGNPDGAKQATRWASALDLDTEQPRYSTFGTVSYQGEIDNLPVTVWAITDLDPFYRR